MWRSYPSLSQQLQMSTSLLQGYENAPPLPEGYSVDGKSLVNTAGPLSACYDAFPEPFMKNKNGFDFHSEYIEALNLGLPED